MRSGLRRVRRADPSTVSPEARLVLAAIRSEVDADGAFVGGNARAAELSGLPVESAACALTELAARGWLRMRGFRTAPRAGRP